MNNIVTEIRTAVEAIKAIPAIQAAYPKGTGKPYYMAGHLQEIQNRLLNKSKDKIEKYTKYPLIVLRLDTPETVESNVSYFNLNIIIVTQTEKNINAEDRVTEIFEPILYPLYEAFINAIVDSGLFMFDGDPSMPDHVKIDRPYWGTVGPNANQSNEMSDPLDAIEIINLKINRVNC